jgi:hypothetical protein
MPLAALDDRTRTVQLKKIDVHGKTVDGSRCWGTRFGEILERLPPRPETDYSLPVACSECGRHRPPAVPQTEKTCAPCYNAGHYFRLKGRLELLWTALVHEALGYADAAARRRAVAATLPPEPRELGPNRDLVA